MKEVHKRSCYRKKKDSLPLKHSKQKKEARFFGFRLHILYETPNIIFWLFFGIFEVLNVKCYSIESGNKPKVSVFISLLRMPKGLQNCFCLFLE